MSPMCQEQASQSELMFVTRTELLTDAGVHDRMRAYLKTVGQAGQAPGARQNTNIVCGSAALWHADSGYLIDFGVLTRCSKM
jgi:hypothetical protein